MNLLILDPLAREYKKALEPKFPEVTIQAAIREDDIGDSVEKANILLTFRISDGLLKRADNLMWIQSMASGVDAMVNLPSLKKEILLTSTRGIHRPQMSEMAILLMLSLSRDFPQIIRNQDQGIWQRWQAKPLHEKKVGILGIGAIGEEIAKKCKAFGMVVFGIDLIRREVDAVDHFYGPEDLLKVVEELDYLIIVAPLTSQTRKMVGREIFSSMKPTSFLINLGRGEIVDEDALVQALESGQIAGAALDVFCREPLPRGHPLWKTRNLIITPHIGGTSTAYVEQVLSVFEENLRRFLRGERQSLVNLVER